MNPIVYVLNGPNLNLLVPTSQSDSTRSSTKSYVAANPAPKRSNGGGVLVLESVGKIPGQNREVNVGNE